MADKEVTKKPTRKTPVKTGAISKQKDLKEVAYTGKERDTGNFRKKPQKEDEESVLKDILSISGQSGLFKYISQARNGIIVESLGTGRRMNAFASMKINSLKDIAIFSKEGEIPLEEVFKKIYEKENGEQAIDYKSEPAKLDAYFSGIITEYDKDRVYISDIRKVISWYNILQSLDMLKFKKEPESGDEKKVVKKEKQGEKSQG